MKVPSSKFRDTSALVVIAHNIRSAYNVGGIFRTADASGASKVYLTGYSPSPAKEGALYRENGMAVLEANAKYLSAGPVVVMVWEGSQAIGIIRKITGGTEPMSSDVGTIRGDFTIDSYGLADTDKRSVRNLIHASGNEEEAKKEIAIWFAEEELIKYNHVQDMVLYDVNMDGILE